MKRRTERCAVHVDHGKRPPLDPDGVDHQRIAFIMADGIPIPGRRHLRRMGLVQPHLTKFMIAQVEEQDFVRQLQHLQAVLEKDVGDA